MKRGKLLDARPTFTGRPPDVVLVDAALFMSPPSSRVVKFLYDLDTKGRFSHLLAGFVSCDFDLLGDRLANLTGTLDIIFVSTDEYWCRLFPAACMGKGYQFRFYTRTRLKSYLTHQGSLVSFYTARSSRNDFCLDNIQYANDKEAERLRE